MVGRPGIANVLEANFAVGNHGTETRESGVLTAGIAEMREAGVLEIVVSFSISKTAMPRPVAVVACVANILKDTTAGGTISSQRMSPSQIDSQSCNARALHAWRRPRHLP